MDIGEPLPSGGAFGFAKSGTEEEIVKAVSNEMIRMWNQATPETALSILASVVLTVCLNQDDPVEAFNAIMLNVAAAIRHHMTPVVGSA